MTQNVLLLKVMSVVVWVGRVRSCNTGLSKSKGRREGGSKVWRACMKQCNIVAA
jgi:hypothetical protein